MAATKESQNTSTQGGSTSHTSSSTVGGSNTHSETNSHTEGGSHSYSYGRSWADGEIEDNTQEHRDKYNVDYEEGDKVKETYQRLQDTLSGKPTFESTFEDKLNNLYDQIMNREKFSYNFNADQMYQMYKNNYTQQGKKAMENTMARAQAATGGYGSSYAQSVASQEYQNYLKKANDIIPTLRNQAYQQYQDEGTELYNKYNITSNEYNREYGQYRDEVSDWQADRSFDYGMYSDERNFDYNKFTTERGFWNDEYWNEKNSAWSNYQITDTNYWEDTHAVTDSATSYWENSESDNVSSSWQNSNTSYNYGAGAAARASASAGSGGSGKKTGNTKQSATSSYTPDTTFQDRANTNEEIAARNGLNKNSALQNTDILNSIIGGADRSGGTDQFLEDALENGYTYNGTTYNITEKDIEYILKQLYKRHGSESVGRLG